MSDYRRCESCKTLYNWRKSSSRHLRMTFCSYTCEFKKNGFLIEQFDQVVHYPAHVIEDPELAEAYKELITSNATVS